jgi:hypothetical protein
MNKNEKMLKCSVCGKDTPAGHDAEKITCAECVAKGNHPVKSYFKEPKVKKNKWDKNEKKTEKAKEQVQKEISKTAEPKSERKKVSRIKFILERIAKGMNDADIVAEINKGIPQWRDKDEIKLAYIKLQREKKNNEVAKQEVGNEKENKGA